MYHNIGTAVNTSREYFCWLPTAVLQEEVVSFNFLSSFFRMKQILRAPATKHHCQRQTQLSGNAAN